MNKKVIITVCFIFSFFIFSFSRTFSLYGDKKAKQIDDVITVIVLEEAKAINKTQTDSEKGSEIGLKTSADDGGILGFLPNWGISGENNVDFRGRGETSRRGEFSAKVTVRVVEVLDNGNLLIQGSKIVEINNEKETMLVSGIIRPEDIRADNTVLSYNIADAKITYSGNGTTHSAQKPGIITRFFSWLF